MVPGRKSAAADFCELLWTSARTTRNCRGDGRSHPSEAPRPSRSTATWSTLARGSSARRSTYGSIAIISWCWCASRIGNLLAEVQTFLVGSNGLFAIPSDRIELGFGSAVLLATGRTDGGRGRNGASVLFGGAISQSMDRVGLGGRSFDLQDEASRSQGGTSRDGIASPGSTGEPFSAGGGRKQCHPRRSEA